MPGVIDGPPPIEFDLDFGSLPDDDLIESLEATDESTAEPAAEAEPTLAGPSERGRFLYFDLETIPDESRVDQFDLPPIPVAPPTTSAAACLTADNIAAATIDQLRDWLDSHWPPEQWLSDARAWESAAKKPRAGVFAAIDSQAAKIAKVSGAAEERRKLLSVTPEFCRIASLALAVDDGPAACHLQSPISERQILEWFWAHAARTQVFVGFNIAGFDLNVLLIRSMICGVKPTRDFAGMKPWDTAVCDLMLRRWPRGGQMKLKAWAKSLGIEIPAGDCDGSEVLGLFNGSAEDRLRLREYNKSDVIVTRSIHRKLMGYYW